jgi:SAM-dependent methyltransferase
MSPNQPSDTTVAYYDRNARAFVDATLGLCMEPLYQPFLDLVPAGGHILDAGCGSGRDAREFLRRGYRVTAIDASQQMARLAAAVIGKPVEVLRIEDLAVEEEFDGIWACASLIHVPRRDIDNVLCRLGRTLRPGGVLYMSLKWGEGQRVEEGRLFNDYTENGFRPLLAGHALLSLLRAWRTDDVRPAKQGDTWLNVLARRTRTSR